MGTKLLKAAFSILGTAFCLTTVAVAWDSESGDDHCKRFIILSATPDAPAGAKGFGAVELGICGGTNAPILRVGTEGLLVGTYTLSVTDNTGTNTADLGTFDVRQLMIMTLIPQGWTNPPPVITVGGTQQPLPEGFDATNGFTVSIADSNAVVDLTGAFGSFTNPPPHREFREAALLTATTNAPVGAVGRAVLKVEGDEEDDESDGEISVRTIGLSIGAYTATITDVDSNAFILGTFDVSTRTNDDEDEQGDDNSQGDNNSQGDSSGWWTTNPVGHAEFPLPAGLAASNVVTISISDSNGVVDLVGDFTTATNAFHCDFDEHVFLVPGPTCTNLQGNADLHLQVLKGKSRGKFSLIAQGVPASQRLSLFVNAVSAGTVKSSRQGKLTIKRLPKSVKLMNVTTVEVRDIRGNVVFTASF